MMAKNNWYKRKINGTIETSPKKRQIVAGRTDTEFGVGSEMGTPESEPGVVKDKFKKFEMEKAVYVGE